MILGVLVPDLFQLAQVELNYSIQARVIFHDQSASPTFSFFFISHYGIDPRDMA